MIYSLMKSDLIPILEYNNRYPDRYIEKAVDQLIKDNLRYNTVTGYLHQRNNWIAKPSSQYDIDRINNRDDVLRYHFKPDIMNLAYKIKEGSI